MTEFEDAIVSNQTVDDPLIWEFFQHNIWTWMDFFFRSPGRHVRVGLQTHGD